jgi:predicted metal-binding protein
MRSLVFCTTCRYSLEEALGPNGLTGGETLAREAEALLAERRRNDIEVRRQACLWSCKRHCNVWFCDPRRFTFIAGDFSPTREAAEGILDWFDLHGATADGLVPFREWPQAVRGHFIARLPPMGGPGRPDAAPPESEDRS